MKKPRHRIDFNELFATASFAVISDIGSTIGVFQRSSIVDPQR